MSGKLMGEVYGLSLPRGQRDVLLALCENANDEGGDCFPGVPLLAWKTDYSERQVQRHLRELESIGLITAVARGGRGRGIGYLIDLSKGVKKSPFKGHEKGDKTSPFMKEGKGDNSAQRVTPDVTLSQSDESQKGDISSKRVTPDVTPTEKQKGDISDIKGDILSIKGDISSSPYKEHEPSLEPPCEPPVERALSLSLPEGLIENQAVRMLWLRFRPEKLPSIGVQERIARDVTDFDRWKETLDYWEANDYRPASYGKMIDRYLETDPSRQQSANGRAKYEFSQSNRNRRDYPSESATLTNSDPLRSKTKIGKRPGEA